MGSYAYPAQTRTAQSVVFELTVLPSARAASDSHRKRTFTLDRTLRIGAQAGNHIVIEDEGIDAFHARFIPGLDAAVLVLGENSASINGVVVRGSVGLIPGDVLSFGEHELQVSAHGADEDCGATKSAFWQLVSDDGRASVQLGTEIIIGSAATCGICLTDAEVATRHAQLAPRNGALWIRDFSDGATFVNERPVSGARQLGPGDTLRIGQHRFRIDREPCTAGKPPDVIAVAAAEDLGNSSHSESPSAAYAPAAKAAQSRAAIWEMDEPVEIPAEEGLLFESDAEFERPPLSSVAVAIAPVASPPARDNVRAEERRVAPSRVEPRVSTRGPTSARSAPRVGKRIARWRVPALLLVLTLAWVVAMRPPESRELVSRILESQELADSFDRVVEVGRSVLLRTTAATQSPEASETVLTPSEPASAGVLKVPGLPEQPADGELARATQDIVELQRKAAAGDTVAIAHLKELGDFYAQLASSAMERGDGAGAQRHMAMVSLMRSTPTTPASVVGPASPDSISQERPTSPVDALVLEARQLESQGAIVSPERRNVVNVLVDALSLEPADEGAHRQLNLVIGSLNGRIATLIANHQFEAAGTLLAQLARGGIPVLSNGNVRDRPPFLDAQSWRTLAVSSLLVEADALIQKGLIATPGDDNAISRLESATRIDPANPLIDDMRAKSSGMLFLAAHQADQQGLSEEAKRLANLATYVRDGFGA